jgi:outer membrane immunogenic protein
MRKSLLLGVCASALVAGSALAADLPLKARPAPVAPIPVFSWTGFYLGANIGGAWSNSTLTDNVTGANFSTNNSGFIGGGQFGYNWQVNNNWVLGIEGDIDGTSIHKTSNAVPTAFGTLQGSLNTDWIATLAGRVGYTFDHWMIYGKGGGAWVQNSATLNTLTTGASASVSNTNSGWMAGVGAEWAFAGPWSAKIEYNHIGLDNWSPSTSSVILNDRLNLSRNIDLVKFGINYRFGGGYGAGGYGAY